MEKVLRLEGWIAGRLEGYKIGRLEGYAGRLGLKGWKVRTLEGEKAGRFKGFCHFPCFQTLLEKVGRLESSEVG